MKEQYTYYIVPTLWHLWPSEPTLLPTNLPSLIQYNMATSCAASQTLPASLKKVVPVRRRSQGSLPYRPRLIPVYPTPRSHLPPTPGHYNKPRFYPSYIYQTSLCTTKRAASTTTPLKSKIRTLYPLQPSWSMSQPVGLPTPAYTNLPACLPATYKILTHLTYPHLPTPTKTDEFSEKFRRGFDPPPP